MLLADGAAVVAVTASVTVGLMVVAVAAAVAVVTFVAVVAIASAAVSVLMTTTTTVGCIDDHVSAPGCCCLCFWLAALLQELCFLSLQLPSLLLQQ